MRTWQDSSTAKAAIPFFRTMYLHLHGALPIKRTNDKRLMLAEVLTIDAFDTLITRPLSRPIDIFLIHGLSLRERSIILMTPSRWRSVRHEAEQTLAKATYPKQVTLEEIYEKLVSDAFISRKNIIEALELEILLEKSLCRPIEANINIVKDFVSRGGRAYVISDTCLPHSVLYQLLSRCGVRLPSDAVFASSVSRHTKHSGELFADLARTAQPLKKILHVGDNFGSDVQRARAWGVPAAPYLEGRPSRYEASACELTEDSELLASIFAGSARAVRLRRSFLSSHEQTVWDVSANVVGPLLVSFVIWSLREAVRLRLRTLYFLARDGEILTKIAKVLAPKFAPNVECRYLYVSRQSLHLASLVEVGMADREWILEGAEGRTLREHLDRLDIQPFELLFHVPPESQLRRLPPDGRLTAACVSEISRALDVSEFRALVVQRSAYRRAACLDYMAQEGLLDPGAIGVVDVGWRGRLQRSLCRILTTQEARFQERLHGFYIDLTSFPDNSGTFTMFSELCGLEAGNWAKRGPLFEVFCAATHGTTKNYFRAEDGLSGPLLESEKNPLAEDWGLIVQQEAVIAFAQEMGDMLLLARLDPFNHVEALAQSARKVTEMFFEYPLREEANAYGQFLHSEDEQHRQLEPLAGLMDFHPRNLLKFAKSGRSSRRISYWPEGSVARSVKPVFRWTCLTALKYAPGRHN